MKVDFYYNVALTDISELQYLTNLEHLNLDYCNISDVSALEGLTNLRYLFLNYNDRLADGTPLLNLTNLTNLTNLKELYIRATAITAEQHAELVDTLENCAIYY